MANLLTVLYFDTTDASESNWKWVELKNRVENPSYNSGAAMSLSNLPYAYMGGSPVLVCDIMDEFGATMECKLRLANYSLRRKDWTGSEALSENPLANGQLGQFSDKLPEYTQIIIRETETFMTLFVGMVYISEEVFDPHYGGVLDLTCRDSLEEINQGNFDAFEPEDAIITLSDITQNNVSNGRGNYPTTISRNLDIIKDITKKTSYRGTADYQIPLISYVPHKIDNEGNTNIQAFTEEQVTCGSNDKKFDYSRRAGQAPLSLIQEMANNELYTADSKTTQGMGFFLDTVLYQARLSGASGVGPFLGGGGITNQDLVYFKKGRYATATPSTYGLTAQYATDNSIPESETSANDKNRNMFNDFRFSGFSSNGMTHIVLTYPNWVEDYESLNGDGIELAELRIKSQPIKPDGTANDFYGYTYDGFAGIENGEPGEGWRKETFGMILVRPNDGESTLPDFRWKQGNNQTNPLRNVRTFNQVSSFHTNGTGVSIPADFAGNAKSWVGNVQYQSEEPDADGNFFLILSNPQDDVLDSLAENAELSERGFGSPQRQCRFVAYPAKEKGQRRVVSINAKEAGLVTFYDMRHYLGSQFANANNKKTKRMRKGYFRITDWPHVRLTDTTQSGSSGTSFVLNLSGTLTPLNWGVRTGCSVTATSVAGYKYGGYVQAVVASSDTVVATLHRADSLTEASPPWWNWAAGQTYNIHIPYRTGMNMRVDNKWAKTIGDHIITSIHYVWSNGHVSSEITTVGINDEAVFRSRERLRQSTLETFDDVNEPLQLDRRQLGAGAYNLEGVLWWHDHEYGATPNVASTTGGTGGTSLLDYNSFAWSGGRLRVNGTGNSYLFKAGNTDAQLTAAGYTSPMQANKQYILYFDTALKGADNKYTLQMAEILSGGDGYASIPTHVTVAYLTIGKNEDAGSKTIGIPGSSYYSTTINFPQGMPNIQFMNTFTNVLGVDNILVESDRILQANSLTTALLKKGAGRPFTSNLRIAGSAYNAIFWDNAQPGIAYNNTNATLTFGNGDVVTIAHGTKTSGLSNNSTTYMYLDGTSAGLTGTLTPQFTTTHATAIGDNKLLLATITVGADAAQTSPVIMPFTSKQLTIAAGAISANAVIADHIKAGSLDAKTITLTGNDGKIRTSSGVNKVGSSAATGTGIVINNSGLYGVNSNTGQFEIRTDGKAYFGGGDVLLDSSGITIESTGTNDNYIKFVNGSAAMESEFYASGGTTIWYAPEGKKIHIGREGQSTTHITDEITLAAKRVRFITNGSLYSVTPYEFPNDTPVANDVLTTAYLSSGVAHLDWASRLQLASGSVSSPTYTFSADPDTGMYLDSALAFTYGGTLKLKIKNTEIEAHDDIRPVANSVYYLGDQNTKRWYKLYAQTATDVSSDAELKENKTPITNGLDFISRLNPITFNRKSTSEVEFGFTAQEMKQAVLASGYTEDMDVYSESVDEETGKTSWGIAYESLVAPLVAAIKELKERIEILEGN